MVKSLCGGKVHTIFLRIGESLQEVVMRDSADQPEMLYSASQGEPQFKVSFGMCVHMHVWYGYVIENMCKPENNLVQSIISFYLSMGSKD